MVDRSPPGSPPGSPPPDAFVTPPARERVLLTPPAPRVKRRRSKDGAFPPAASLSGACARCGRFGALRDGRLCWALECALRDEGALEGGGKRRREGDAVADGDGGGSVEGAGAGDGGGEEGDGVDEGAAAPAPVQPCSPVSSCVGGPGGTAAAAGAEQSVETSEAADGDRDDDDDGASAGEPEVAENVGGDDGIESGGGSLRSSGKRRSLRLIRRR